VDEGPAAHVDERAVVRDLLKGAEDVLEGHLQLRACLHFHERTVMVMMITATKNARVSNLPLRLR
jgi:hypothetical protein